MTRRSHPASRIPSQPKPTSWAPFENDAGDKTYYLMGSARIVKVLDQPNPDGSPPWALDVARDTPRGLEWGRYRIYATLKAAKSAFQALSQDAAIVVLPKGHRAPRKVEGRTERPRAADPKGLEARIDELEKQLTEQTRRLALRDKLG